MAGSWVEDARRELLRLRGGAKGWGYRLGSAPGVEPTALAALALIGSGPVTADDAAGAAVRSSADWLAEIQRRDGSVGLSEARPSPGWTTPYALLLWRALGGFSPRRRRGAAWLLRQAGLAIPKADDPDRIVGHDTTLVGWPWVADTHSWLEPTALAILALLGEGYGGHPRVEEGLRLIRDRAIRGGGWNYGNKAAFGHDLRPQPAPTGLALLALAAAGRSGGSGVAGPAIAYLEASLPGTRAAASLGWGVLGLRAWGRRPAGADAWLAESCRRASGRPDAAPRLAPLVLAAGDHALELFGRGETDGRA